ncbi:cytochrome P450 [Schizophyllum fasciatum]
MLPQLYCSSILIVGVSSLALYLVWRCIYQLFFSPIRNVPGPWYAAVSDLWLTTHIARLQQCMTVHSLFDTYGPIVRIGPNNIAFKDLAGIRPVYSILKLDKGPAYRKLKTAHDADQAMTILEHGPHSARRKAWASQYTINSLSKFQPDMRDAAQDLISTITAIEHERAVDCLVLFRHFTIEVIMSILYGCRLDTLKSWSTGVEDTICEAIGDFPLQVTLRGAAPLWLWRLICKIPHRRWQKICMADTTLVEACQRYIHPFFARGHVNGLRPLMNTEKDSEGKVPLILRLLQYRDPASGLPNLHEKDIIAEAIGHTIAGTDTTAITLSYICWELGKRPDVAAKLRAEIDGAMPDPMVVPNIGILQSLPYLNACVKEGLRIYGAGPSLLERVVRVTPPASTPVTLGGHVIPDGTIVATQSWSLSRDPAVFPSPNEFMPERWLDGDSSAMHAYLNPFGFGTRICGGQNLAQIMLRIGLASIVRNFTIEVPPETTEKSMAICDAFVIFPQAMSCKVCTVLLVRRQHSLKPPSS